ncbi:MAG: sodium:galactoside symporter [Gallionellales bacterium 35-53-114]|jgi:Na+/melibiose symporter-like transporter|nr:MAG: sodium:galactoside symporter [Gallionellales bacterium 35-53-114]OYZ63030.1 MAG: sodium:galactoside symporter [Gallionellales bacterium 24-53-125]OZB08988.1 MAG: sodium:galactoside symporter [Gallionellales bacterium 39-52-133]HQS59332.1 MFS transporter [Gallionellaceae bacterium]HQS76245.1 MFS transporter [Gallionellaceae bacterium]
MTKLIASSYLSYGLFGLPLAMVALPIYVYVPQFYAEQFGLSLTLIGTALLAARILDAFIDPLIGLWIDGSKNSHGYGRFILISLPLLVAGFTLLFHPPAMGQDEVMLWFIISLIMVYAGFSLATIAYQSWGAALTQALAERSRLSATREGFGLLGVILAASLSGIIGLSGLTVIFIVTLLVSAALLLKKSPHPGIAEPVHIGMSSLLEPFHNAKFRWLFAVFIVNGIAAAIPATLFLFFAKDQLQLAQYSGLFLVLYFVAAAASMPLWVALAKRFGEARAWLMAMLLAVLAFIWAYGLSAGDAVPFAIICILSGLTLGADLALPPALLAAVIGRAGHSGLREGAYFGAWNWATKINLALAAGISLPLLSWLGYVPGIDSNGSDALSVAYALLPCLLKLAAAGILLRAPLRDL